MPLLFNVVDDIACEKNVAAEHPDVVKRLSRHAETMRSDLGDRDRKGAGVRPIGKVANPVPVVLMK